jgi:short-subunit dehydrogenase
MTIMPVNQLSSGNPTAFMITGATGGLGKAFAVECASRGWNLFLTDLAPEPLEMLAGGLRRTFDVNVSVQACDLTDASSRTGLFQRIESDGLRFWGLVNVAGMDFEGPFYEQSRQHIRTIVRLNIEGTLEMTHAIMAYRDPTLPFRIINVASLAAFYPMPVKATYAASKRFLMDFSLALRSELREMGATVTVLCPAGMPTTPECVRAIDAQGILGQLTTQNTGSVANLTLNAALKGQAVCIPGRLNQFIQFAGSLVPTAWVIGLIGSRWKSARLKQAVQGV